MQQIEINEVRNRGPQPQPKNKYKEYRKAIEIYKTTFVYEVLESGQKRYKYDDIINLLGPDFKNKTNNAIYMGLKFILSEYGIKVSLFTADGIRGIELTKI